MAEAKITVTETVTQILRTEHCPSWLDGNFVEFHLKKFYCDESLKVLKLVIEICGGGNDGFLSTLLRVHVDYMLREKLYQKPLIVKTVSHLEYTQNITGPEGYDVQNREMSYYKNIAPKIVQVLKEVNDSSEIFPQIIGIDQSCEAIIFEDLKETGFIMADRIIGLDSDHVYNILEKLAKLQAASLILYDRDRNIFESLNTGLISRGVNAFNVFFNTTYKLLIDEVATWPSYECYAVKMKNIQSSLMEGLWRSFDVDPEEFCVLNHGDVWTNNVLIQYDEDGKIKDLRLIDYQFPHWGSSVLDLIHFYFLSLSDELFNQDKIEEFTQYFYYQLRDNLIKLNYSMDKFPSLHKYQIKLTEKYFYAFIFTLLVLPLMLSDDEDNDFKAHNSTDERGMNFKRRILKNPKYQAIAKRMIPVFDRKGLLDPMSL